jgi:putative endonuclease
LDPATFTGKYRTTKLVFAESAETAIDAIALEKKIKRWSREKKIALIESINPDGESIEPD